MPKGMKQTSAQAIKPAAKAAPRAPSTKKVGTKATPKQNANSLTRGQLQGAATAKSGSPKKLSRSNVLFSKTLVDKARTWKNKTFSTTRMKVHKALANDETFLKSKLATPENLKRMKAGKAPIAPKEQWLGKRRKMELDHKWERRDGVKENRVDNLRLVGPLTHKMKMMRKFHKAANTEMPGGLMEAPKKGIRQGVKIN